MHSSTLHSKNRLEAINKNSNSTRTSDIHIYSITHLTSLTFPIFYAAPLLSDTSEILQLLLLLAPQARQRSTYFNETY